MKLLASEDELRSLFSPAEQEAYLGPAWHGTDQAEITTDVVSMGFESPAHGSLVAKGGHKVGEKYFVVTVTTEFNAVNGGG